MRHLWSLLAGVVAAPLAWLFLSTGQHRSQRLVERWDQAGSFDTVDLIGPVAFLAVAGILLGLIGTLRWSPAGPMVAGLLLITPTVLMFLHPFQTLEGFLRPEDGGVRRFLYQDLEPWLPVENGTLLVLGALLLMAVFSAQRWRRWPGNSGPGQTTPGQTTGQTAPGQTPGRTAPAGQTAPEKTTTDPVAAGLSPPAGQRSGAAAATGTSGGSAGGGSTMTDDEILAAAAAFETAQQRDNPASTLPRRTPGRSGGPGKANPTGTTKGANPSSTTEGNAGSTPSGK